MTNNKHKRSELANCIALHDFAVPSPKQVKELFEYTVEFFRNNGIEPTRISNPKPKSTKSITFKIGQKKWLEAGFGNIDVGMSMKAWDVNDETLFLWWVKPTHDGSTILLTFDNEIVGFDHDIIKKLSRDLSNFVKPKYGYCFQRKWELGPEWYPFGVIQGIKDFGNIERKKIGKWNLEYQMDDGNYRTGDLRDIYPMNVICEQHLSREVLGTNLKDWILSDSSHGKLEELNKDLYAWWVDEDQISNVRESLRDTGIILCI